ncbi:MAG: bifunctional phosphopantothenoylcysteine decarboxylase/phosphopantothenate synthase [Planctomycetia bacterium]|nr:bifunctional phosphopantothenoylcysteine decarboxylase/phosphopantothenate synthase [Planctomycetia bacterium]
MNLLVTAGNTLAPIDKVRGLTNIFTGRTGAAIAAEAKSRGHSVTLLTSHPQPGDVPFRTFDELHHLMADHVPRADAVVHCAAVSDYLVAGTYTAALGCGNPVDNSGKIKSDMPELWLRLVRAPKLVDQIREPWGFRGVLVKFKLEVGISDEQLLTIAERSRVQSRADLMVANTLEGASRVAFLGPLTSGYERIARPDLPRCLLEEIERRI